MKPKKIFILLPDGVGLRNFAFSNFYETGKEKDFEITYWNKTFFDLEDLNYPELKIASGKNHFLTDILKNARKHIELNLNIKKSTSEVYNTYRFPFVYSTFKNALRSILSKFLIFFFSSETGLKIIRTFIKKIESNTTYFEACVNQLRQEKPDFIFCTNQRPVLGIAPILAAQSLNIPTATFIFSWDNLPKATMVIETDYYFVWSTHMKNELLYYYPYIKKEQIVVAGTPQFETHYNSTVIQSKESFFETYNLDVNKKYICYSGDDVTTSPNDPIYLEDVAKAVRQLNEEGKNVGIVFRRCPVDVSSRFDVVLKTYSDVITPIQPKWEKAGNSWNTILPTKEDMSLLANTIYHTEFVINLGSSMVFDYVIFKKPCIYINYDVNDCVNKEWTVKKIYNYIHFQSMPSKEAVLWCYNNKDLKQLFGKILNNELSNVIEANKWFEKITEQPAHLASERIWNEINSII
jgi:hypothetical protein